MANFNKFTEQEKEFIRDNFHSMSLTEIAEKLGRSFGGVKTWSLKLGLRRNNRYDWTDEKVRILVDMYANHSDPEIAEVLETEIYVVYKKAERLGLKKDADYLKALNKRMGENLQKNGYGTRFVKGHTPWCKGKKVGVFPGSEKGHFKKGSRPHNYLPVGTILPVSCMPYLKIKIADPNKWAFLHRHNWEKANGAIPDGLVIWFKDQNPKNCAVENLELITRKELRNRNAIYNLPPELQDAYRVLGRLKQAINRKLKKEKDDAQK